MKKLSEKSSSHFINRYNNSYDYSIENVYKNCSVFKYRAEKWCKNRMNELNGLGYKIIGYNCMKFTCGFMAEIDGKNCLVVETADNEYCIEL